MNATDNTKISIFWDPIVPAAAISSMTYTVVYTSIMGTTERVSSTINSGFVATYIISGLRIAPNTQVEVSLLTSNKYGDGAAVSQKLTSSMTFWWICIYLHYC